MALPSDIWSSLFEKDPTGRAVHGLELMNKYRPAIGRQHIRLFEAWRTKDYEDALVELHFFLIGLDRVQDGVELAGKALGGDANAWVVTRSFADYRDARNHFEHLDDRLFGTRRNAPQPITDGGATRTIHFGLKSSPFPRFEWGAKSIDLSTSFVDGYLAYVSEAERLMLG